MRHERLHSLLSTDTSGGGPNRGRKLGPDKGSVKMKGPAKNAGKCLAKPNLWHSAGPISLIVIGFESGGVVSIMRKVSVVRKTSRVPEFKNSWGAFICDPCSLEVVETSGVTVSAGLAFSPAEPIIRDMVRQDGPRRFRQGTAHFSGSAAHAARSEGCIAAD